MIHPTYYRSRLLPEEQKAYQDVVNALLSYSRHAVFHAPVSNRISIAKTIRAVHLDHPELVYVDFWNYYTIADPLSGSVTVIFHFLLEREVSEKVLASLKVKAASLALRVQGLNDPQKYCEVIREVAGSTNYVDTDSAFWDHTAAGPVLLHSAVCEGIAKIFLYYCQRTCLPCAIITGSFRGIPHAWNMIEYNGTFFYIDITGLLDLSAPPALNDTNLTSYLMTREQLLDAGYVWVKER